ncbi:hypothetical protein HUK84_08080, partial [Nguyenibacter vanlangensis]|nr:hypothetical protein [Nguyenibacter vanlangensis]
TARIAGSASPAALAPALAGDDETVSIDGVEGKMRMVAIAKVAARMEESPRETVFIIRNWLAAPESRAGAGT